METVELIVYFALAFVLGALIIGFISGWDAEKTFTGFRQLFQPDRNTAYEEVTLQEFPTVVFKTWDACGLGTADFNKTIYVTDTGTVNKTMVFTRIKAASLCKSLQWSQVGCGSRDDVLLTETATPAVLTLRCNATTQKLIISS